MYSAFRLSFKYEILTDQQERKRSTTKYCQEDNKPWR